MSTAIDSLAILILAIWIRFLSGEIRRLRRDVGERNVAIADLRARVVALESERKAAPPTEIP